MVLNLGVNVKVKVKVDRALLASSLCFAEAREQRRLSGAEISSERQDCSERVNGINITPQCTPRLLIKRKTHQAPLFDCTVYV
jgi:hypothetical protein